MQNRVNIYVTPEKRRKIKRKAKKLGVSVSELLVSSALNFEGDKK
ncbi:hypothetical protein [Ferroplasma sp.]|jgi:uncharacterized protein (DUF1778 family)|nr:hypothetical protein [Ferroplasma sp.]